MSERKVDEALMDRIIAAVDEAGVSRAAVEGEWPECHKPRCQGHHGSPDVAMSYMKHQIIEAVKLELRYEVTTRPDVSRTGDTPEQTAAFTLGVLLHQYRPDVTGTYAKAAQLIVDAYPGIIPALSGVVAEEPEGDDEPCKAEIWSWDIFRHQEVDPYWMRCHRIGAHDKHENSETGATWPVKQEGAETDA